MPGSSNIRRQAAIKRATALVTEAMDLIDGHGGPPEASAHLDLALSMLRAGMKDGPRRF